MSPFDFSFGGPATAPTDSSGDGGILGGLIGVINAVGTNVATVYHSVNAPSQPPVSTLPTFYSQQQAGNFGGISSSTIILVLVVGLGAFLLFRAAK